jgi:hypothetical protein
MKSPRWAVAFALVAAACGPTPEEQAQLAELPIVTAEKARLQGEVERLTAEISQIQTELSSLTMIQASASQEATPPSTPATVSQLVAHVGEVEDQLTAAQRRLRSVNATSAQQVERIASLEASIEEERATLEGQRQRVASLEASIASLEAEVGRQGEVNAQLEQTVETMVDDANEVWYVVGTKDELIDRGIIQEEGGSRVLFIFGKRGQTLVPSRTMDPTMFTAADQRTLSQIVLPVTEGDEAKWTVVTSQDLGAVGSPLDERGRVLGDALSITDPQRFWANGRYLIVVRS